MNLSQKNDHYTQCGLLSLDVFDTSLTRSCGAPHALYLWLGRKLSRSNSIQCSPEVFARARIRSEQIVWSRHGSMDANVSIYDFYRELVNILWMDKDHINFLMNEELRLEERVLKSVQIAKIIIARRDALHKETIFLHDGYFTSNFIKKRLEENGITSVNKLCLSSSEQGKSKASGRLFDHLLSSTNHRPFDIYHVGDNHHSDYIMPKWKNIKSRWFIEGKLNRYELIWSEQMWSTSGLSAAFSGASRLTRLQNINVEFQHRSIRDVAASVAAPAITGYVLWLLFEAKKLELQRLYFLSRDGQILYQVAKKLVRKLSLKIQCRYLVVSRQSTNLAATFEGNSDELGWIFRDLKTLTVHKFLSRFDFQWDDVKDVMIALGISEHDQNISVATGKKLALELTDGALNKLLLKNAEKRRLVVNKYLEQEGVLSNSFCGLVDFGGVGSQMAALHRLVTNAGFKSPKLFLMGIDYYVNPIFGPHKADKRWLKDTEIYLYDHLRQRGIKRARGFGTFMQMFFAADHGTCKGYLVRQNQVVPILSKSVDEDMVGWGLPMFQNTVLNFIDNLTIEDDLVDVYADVRQASCDVILKLWSDPSYAEAKAWGAFPIEGAEASDGVPRPLAEPYSWQLVIRDSLRKSFPKQIWTHWYEGSVRLSPPLLRFTLKKALQAYYYIADGKHPVHRFLNRYIRRLLGRSIS